MDQVLHEVALLTPYTRHLVDPVSDPWLDPSMCHAPVSIPVNDQLLDNVNMLTNLLNPQSSELSLPTEHVVLNKDFELNLFSETESAVENLLEGFSGETDYITASAPSNIYSEGSETHHLRKSRSDCQESESCSSVEEGSSESGKSAGMSDMNELINMISNQIEGISKGEAHSDEAESEDYFSASSHPDEDSSDCRSRSISLSSGHCSRFSSRSRSSRSSSFSGDVRSRSRSVGSNSEPRSRSSSFGCGTRSRSQSTGRDSTSGSRSRSPSVGHPLSRNGSEVFIDNVNLATEDFFGDVESLEVGKPFSPRRKKQLRMKKGKNSLATIYSPAVLRTEVSSGETEDDTDEIKDYTPRKRTKKMLVKPEAFFTCDSRSASHGQSLTDDGFTTEGSSLNPLAGAFVPRAFKNRLASSSSDYDSVYETAPVHISVNDSGFGSSNTTFNQSGVNSTYDRSRLSSHNVRDQTIYESTSYSGYETGQDHAIKTHQSVYVNDVKPVDPTPLAPYKCSVNHKDEFCLVKDSFNLLPSDLPSQSAWKTVVSVSQRVVRLCVRKPKSVDVDIDTSKKYSEDRHDCDNEMYGSGFAYYVGTDCVEIRTHIEVVTSAEVASCTTVTFTLDDLETNQRHSVELQGLHEGFVGNRFSRTSVFRCKTSPVLLQYMKYFDDVPVNLQPSLYDSAYQSEDSSQGSTESSRSDNWPLGNCSDPLPIGTKPYTNIASTVTNTPPVTSRPSKNLHRCHDVVSTDVVQFNEDTIDVQWCAPYSHNPFTLCNSTSENAAKSAFESIPSFECKANPTVDDTDSALNLNFNYPTYFNQDPDLPISIPPHPLTSPPHSDYNASPLRILEMVAKEECLSPLKIMEKRSTKLRPGACPYSEVSPFEGVAQYSYFSSYSGDVIDAARPQFPSPHSLTPSAHMPGHASQEFTGLLHAQNFHKQEYDAQVKSLNQEYDAHVQMDVQQEGLMPWDFNVSGDARESPNSNEVYDTEHAMKQDNADPPAEVYKAFNYLDEWDRDLLNMDENLNTMPPFGYYESIVSTIIDEIKPKVSEDSCQSCERSVKRDVAALIVSFPHGGEKVVSCGTFSAHNHHGGDLYDTPTCMGSCGAPIISLRENGGGAYVTPFVHAGTTSVNGVYMGIGVAHFEGEGSKKQAMNIWR